MKLHRLELTGFGPFRERQSVDFDAFERDGVFLISGRTGAGKSSILDGVSFALYGSVPRYEGGERRLCSDHSRLGDPTEVRLEFTVAGRRWRVTRSPEYERPAKRGSGTTTEPTRAELEERIDGVWVGLAAKPREVALALDEVLGLNAQQFQQVVLLAQNKFSRFLLAKGDERQQLLRTLFGTRRFEQYKDDLEQRRRDAQRALDAAQGEAGSLLELAESVVLEHDLAGADEPPADLPGRREAVSRARQRAEYRVEQAGIERARTEADAATATTEHAARVTRAATRRDLATTRERLAALETESERVAADASRAERAGAAEALRAPLETVDRAAAALADAAAAAETARAGWRRAGGTDADDLPAVLDALAGDIARWTATAERERELHAAVDDHAARTVAAAELSARLESLDAQRSLVPAERQRLDAEILEATTGAAGAADRRARLDELARRLHAAQEADALTDAAAVREREYADASAAADAAGATVTDLLRRRLAGRAGELAAGLVAGEPCAVCGSTEHPEPAAPAADAVTDDDLTSAEAARDAARRRADAAAAAFHEAQTALAALRVAAGGRDADSLTAERDVALAAVADADAAAKRRDALTAERAALEERETADAVARTSVAEELGQMQQARAALAAGIEALRAELADARGDHDSVAERLADAVARRYAARNARDAVAVQEERARALADAEKDRDARVRTSIFADVDDVVGALLTPRERAALEAGVAEHRAALTATKARLLELELAVAEGPDEEPDLVASEEAVRAADAARAAAIAAERDAEHVARQLRDLVDRTERAYGDMDGLAQDAAAVIRLADTVAGRAPNTRKMDLETFVLAAELEEIVAAANLRLREMSSGRYTLSHSDALQARGAASGLSLEVLDAHTGRLRSPQSLSGGETFLASLALALGLAEVVTSRAGGIRLDTLFVDEGFGSLDPETLELAMRTLDELRTGGRTVGVISHVEAMKEQLPAQLVVEATPEGPSRILQDAAGDSRTAPLAPTPERLG
jgi:exonuclease SbcC